MVHGDVEIAFEKASTKDHGQRKNTATILETCQVKQLKFLGDGVSFLKGNAKKNPMGISTN